MRVLITGGGGQLGTELAQVCGAAGDEVIVCAHTDLDITDRTQTIATIRAAKPEVVMHAGAWTNVDGCETDPTRAYLVNALGSRNVAEAAATVEARVIYVSSDYVFDGRGGGAAGGEPYREWDAPNPISHYGRSKLGGERETLDILGSAATIVRATWVCGAFGNNFVKTMLRLANDPEGKQVTVVHDQRGCPTFTPDLAGTMRELAVGGYPGIFHVSNDGPVSWCEFAQAIFAAAGADTSRVVPITTQQLVPVRPAPRPAFSVLDNAALRGVGLPAMPHWGQPLAATVAALQG